jgi:uncharacterized cupin superfamily protein
MSAADGVHAPVATASLPREAVHEGTDRSLRVRALSDLAGRARVGVGLLELAPRCHTGPAHWHSHEEEHLLVLEGRGRLHLGDGVHPLAPGDYVRFPAGRAVPHRLEADPDATLVYLMIGERDAADGVTHVT